jgi:hypothetical protein
MIMRPAHCAGAIAGRARSVRWCVDGLLGRPAPAQRADVHYARIATVRTPMSQTERERLAQLPLEFRCSDN